MSEQSKVVVPLAGLSCGGCVRKLTEALQALDGVEDVQVDKQRASVVGAVSRDAVVHVVEELGYEVPDVVQMVLDLSGLSCGKCVAKVEAALDARMQLRPIMRHQSQFQHPPRQSRRWRVLALPLTDGLAGDALHFQCALDALRVAGMDARGRFRIDLRQLRMQRRPSVLSRLRGECFAQLRIGLRQRRQAVQ